MSSKRPQLRRCRNCQKVGHNTSTCSFSVSNASKSLSKSFPTNIVKKNNSKPSMLEQKTQSKTSAQNTSISPLKFYVHHVTFEPKHSPHVVNLKKHSTSSIWDQVNAVAPKAVEDEKSLYHFHHENTQAPEHIAPTEKNTPEITPLFVPFKPIDDQFHFEKNDTIEKDELQPKSSFLKNFFKKKLIEKNDFVPFIVQSNKINDQETQPASTHQTEFTLSKNTLFSRLFSRNSDKASEPANDSQPKIKLSLKERWDNFSTSLTDRLVVRKRLAFALTFLLIATLVPSHARGYYSSLMQTKQVITDKSTAGFMALQESTTALLSSNFINAQESTVDALQNFNAAITTLEQNHQLLQKIISVIPIMKDEVQSRQKLIEAGQKLSLGNTYLLKGLSTISASSDQKPTERLTILINHLQAALPSYTGAIDDLNLVDSDNLPPEFQAPFKDFKKIFSAAVHDFKQLTQLGTSFQEIFGGKGLRRYAIMFQNPDELRATGGFTGSFAIIDIKDGNLVKVDVPPGGTYSVQGQLSKYIEPPAPLLLFEKGYWQFQDANWFPDFKTSAENTLWFYRQTGRGSVDGVIAINSTFLTRLLGVMGPVQDQKRGITLTSDNALATLRTTIDSANATRDGSELPKQVLSDLTPQFIDYFKNLKPENLLPLLTTVKESLDEKEIQLYFTDPDVENKIQSFGWAGTISPTPPTQDYLHINMTNIYGGKTDARMEQHTAHQALVQEDGSIINTIAISRKNTTKADELAYQRPNIAYFRIYVPEGSELLSLSGVVQPTESAFHPAVSWAEKSELLSSVEKQTGTDEKTGTRITTEFGKTVFGNWIITKPGETSEIIISYKLPFKIFSDQSARPETSWQKILATPRPEVATYQLMLQKQSGVKKNEFESQIIFPQGWNPLWNEGDHSNLAANGASITSFDLKHDMIWSLAMQKNN